MKYNGILEKLLLIFKLILGNKIYIVFATLIFITLLLMFRKKLSKKQCLIINFLATTSLIAYTIINNFKILSTTFDSIMNNLFTNIYFPSINLYLTILLTINIIGIINLLNKKQNKASKIVNSTSLIIIDFILVLILEIISKNEINLFEKVSLFSNTSLVMLMELTVNVFIFWVISLIIISLTNIIVERRTITITNKELKTSPANITTNIKLDEIEEEYTNGENKFIPSFIKEKELSNISAYKFIPKVSSNIENKQLDEIKIPKAENTLNLQKYEDINEPLTSIFDLSAFIPKSNGIKPINKQEEQLDTDITSLVSSVSDIITKEQNLNEVIEIKQEENERDSYTLNDYKIFNKMLKDIKEYNAGSVISIDKNLEYRLITKYSSENYDMFKKMLKIYL